MKRLITRRPTFSECRCRNLCLPWNVLYSNLIMPLPQWRVFTGLLESCQIHYSHYVDPRSVGVYSTVFIRNLWGTIFKTFFFFFRKLSLVNSCQYPAKQRPSIDKPYLFLIYLSLKAISGLRVWHGNRIKHGHVLTLIILYGLTDMKASLMEAEVQFWMSNPRPLRDMIFPEMLTKVKSSWLCLKSPKLQRN